MGTQTRPNHRSGVRDVHFGWLFKALVAIGLSLLSFIARKAYVIASDVQLLNYRMTKVEEKASETEKHAKEIKRDLDDLDARQHEEFLTKDEYYHDMAPEILRPRR
jgi:hypothetical protein